MQPTDTAREVGLLVVHRHHDVEHRRRGDVVRREGRPVGEVGHVWTPPVVARRAVVVPVAVEQVAPGAELAQQVLQLAGVEVVGQPELGEQRTQLVAVEPPVDSWLSSRPSWLTSSWPRLLSGS